MTDKLTTHDYIYRPLRELVKHPDFDHYRFIKVCAAVREATNTILSAQRQGKI